MNENWRGARRVVVKLGTNIVIGSDGRLARERLKAILGDAGRLWAEGRDILIVSSGAVGLGRGRLALEGRPERPLSLIEKQACAAVGQALLMDEYRRMLGAHGIGTAQILLTASDFSDRTRYLTLRSTLEKLLELRVVPVINENDTVSTMELDEGVYAKSFGDNDKLSALVAAKLEADLLLLLTNVEGIFDSNPDRSPDATLIPRIESFEQLTEIRTSGKSKDGRGGMTAKLEAARLAAISGVTTVICSGMNPGALSSMTGPEDEAAHPGTLVVPQSRPTRRRQWIGLAAGRFGMVRINEGARHALVERQTSLLPVGVVGVEGAFQAGQVISILDEKSQEVGRGISNFSSEELERIRGLSSQEVAERVAGGARKEVVHRDNLVILQEHFAV